MKRRWMIVTAALALVILAAGVGLLPAVYAAVFDGEKIVYEEETLPEELLTAPERFMDSFRHPLTAETESMSAEAREALVKDSRFLLGTELYEKAFGLVGLEEEDRYWETLSVVRGEDSYLIRTQAEKGGKKYAFSAAFNDGLIPFLVCCKSSGQPSEAQVREAVETLEELCQTDGLRRYVEEIDGIYETCREYQNDIRDLYTSLLEEEGTVQEIGETVPLWDCCVRGEWQVCADDSEAALVCIMGEGSLVLYYDAVERGFCGYRIRFGDGD